MTATGSCSQPGALAPVTSRGLWVFCGLVLQAIGTAIPLVIGYDRGVHEGLGGHVTLATVRLVWHQMIHDHHDLPWIAVGVVLFVIGSVVIARPFCRRRLTWLVAVPVGALAGIVVLGAVALLLTLLVLAVDDFDMGWGGGGGSGRRSKRSTDQPEDEER